ncbi:hypothetical protein J4E85_008153 [Alternaria conjuncta]|uniref:uncharacterized protein n=1 Tax=Alternaria conjuncta TaxID=181017 RepID=UPI00221FF22B|nr:uncharacterized protein J4E85_008153 [Alternaria conjuncta]KAI4923994.1 hypothetical protein J4E85_008153 [Alternaria conjuncta]
MSGTTTSLFGGGAPSVPANNDVTSAVQLPSASDAPLPDVDSFASELGNLVLAVQAATDTARVAHDADLVAGRAAQAARVEAIIARKAKEAVMLTASAFIESFGKELKKHGLSIDRQISYISDAPDVC